MYIVKKADEDLLCEKGDEICNAVHNVIIAVAKKTDIDSAIQEAIDSLACTEFHASPEDKTRIIQYVRKHLKDMRFENGEPEWDMHYIGDLMLSLRSSSKRTMCQFVIRGKMRMNVSVMPRTIAASTAPANNLNQSPSC